MAASQLPRPRTKTASRCTPETEQGTHVFEIAGYSLHKKGLDGGAGKFLRSAVFSVGGYEWCVRFYPDGEKGEDFKDYVASYLELMTKNAEVKVFYDLRLVDQTTRSSVSIFRSVSPKLFSRVDVSKNKYAWGSSKFMKKRRLEESSYLRDDLLVIECDVMIIKGALSLEVEVEETNLVEAPSPSLSQDLAHLLTTKEGADVTFMVEGEVFSAHALLLATRSSVFKAEFYGPLREKREQHITIQDMQADVFRAMLHSIYTDSMIPSMADLDTDERKGMIQHLLVAADRYDVQGLKAACERALCQSLDVQTVAAMLVLADQHNCCKLKSACIDFIISPDRWGAVAASEGFSHLKRSCPGILEDVLHKALKSRKI